LEIKRLINRIFKSNQKGITPLFNPLPQGARQNNEEQIILKQMDLRLKKLEGSLEKAVSGYRLMLINNNPDVLPELITGESIEALDSSLLKARELTGRIKEKLDSITAAERIPEGAPSRIAPDTESLSSEEKIRYGLQNTNYRIQVTNKK
jgi:hypothetical protein